MLEMIRGLIGLERRSYLLVEERLDSLIAVVAERKGSKVQLSEEFVVPVQNFNHAVTDLIKVMQSKRVAVPESVVLISPDVIANLTNLPLHPNKKKPKHQMEELLRWELGPLLEQRMMDRSLGMLMMAKGLLELEQVIEIVNKQRNGAPLPVAVPTESEVNLFEDNQDGFDKKARFGEIAVALGYINEDDVKDCLELQQDYQSSGGETVCGYAVAKKMPENKQGKGSYPWLTSVSYEYMIKKRERAFSKSGLKLMKVYSNSSSLGPLLHLQKMSQGKAAVIDLREGELDLSVFENDACVHLENYLLDGKKVGLAEELKEHYIDEIWLKPGVETSQLPDEHLKRNYQIKTLEMTKKIKSPKGLGKQNSRLFSVASHLTGLAPSSSAVPLVLSNDVPTVLNSKLWLRLVLIFSTLIIMIIEGVYWTRYMQVESKKAEVKLYKNTKGSNAKLRAKKVKISDEIKEKQALILFNEQTYPKEKSFLSKLLDKIASSVPPSLIMTAIENKIPDKIILKGWSIDAEAANAFAEKLAEATQDSNLIVQTPLISGDALFFEVEGYGFEMELWKIEADVK